MIKLEPIIQYNKSFIFSYGRQCMVGDKNGYFVALNSDRLQYYRDKAVRLLNMFIRSKIQIMDKLND